MITAARQFICMCAASLCALSVGFASEPGLPRPSGLDGIAIGLTPTSDPLHYFDLTQQAQKLVDAENFAEAEPIADILAKQYPVDGKNWLMAARIKRKLKKFDDAASDYQHAIELLGPGVPGKAEYWRAVSESAGDRTKSSMETLAHLVDVNRYGHRPSLYDDDNLKKLREDPHFLAIVGKAASKQWTRNEGWMHDLDYLVAEVIRVNPDYHDRPLPALFQQRYRDLRNAIPKFSDEQIYVGMSGMLASLNQGHTNLWPFMPATKITFTVIPLQFYVFPEGIFIVSADAENSDLVGAQLLKIEETPALEALKKIKELHASDSGMEILWYGPEQLALTQELKGLGIIDRTDSVALSVRMVDGTVQRRTVSTNTSKTSTKLHAAPDHPAALAFGDVDHAHWFTAMPEADALYVQVNQIMDDRDETLEEFGLKLRKKLQDKNTRNLILDLRHDNGGNTFLYVELLRTLIAFSQDEDKTLYVIIGRGVYSAAANLATDLERLAQPIFVGEPTSMTGNNYGDESEVVLPYSGIWAGVTGVKWQLGYPSDLRRAIVPNIPVALTAADYFAGRDPVLDTIKALCARKHKS